jgi:hypothetical protein
VQDDLSVTAGRLGRANDAGGAARLGHVVHDLVEPVGPLDDPWLEAAAPYDPDPPTDPFDRRTKPDSTDPRTEPDQGSAMDPAALRALRARLAQIKNDAYANPSYYTHSANSNAQNSQPDSAIAEPDSRRTRLRRVQAARTVPMTRAAQASSRAQATPARPDDGTKGQVRPRRRVQDRCVPGRPRSSYTSPTTPWRTGTGVLRAETIGPLLAAQLTELIGYGPYTVKPVIDLNDDAVSVDAYEIPTRIRERVRLMYPVELFPYGTRETTSTIDLDHIEPYDPHGPTGQTSTANLAPLGRFGHRVKTHARGWSVRRIDDRTLEWRTPHGFTSTSTPTAPTESTRECRGGRRGRSGRGWIAGGRGPHRRLLPGTVAMPTRVTAPTWGSGGTCRQSWARTVSSQWWRRDQRYQ